jgi:hypothetical protein
MRRNVRKKVLLICCCLGLGLHRFAICISQRQDINKMNELPVLDQINMAQICNLYLSTTGHQQVE